MNGRSEGSGCAALFFGVLAVALIAMAVISLAALVDPFGWMPSPGAIWRDCQGDCALAHRFPGFWWHAVANLAYLVVAGGAALMLLGCAADLGEARAARFASAEAAERYAETRSAVAWVATVLALAAALPLALAAVGHGDAVVGAVVAGLLVVGVAVAAAPYERTGEEREHRRLQAIWRRLRVDADEDVGWERLAAWAQSAGGAVELVLIRCAPAGRRFGGAPSPFSQEVVRRLDAEDAEVAVEAMEQLRADAAERELDARVRHEQRLFEAEQAEHEHALRALDEAAAKELAEREQAVRAESARRDQAEREAQAAALARALQRP